MIIFPREICPVIGWFIGYLIQYQVDFDHQLISKLEKTKNTKLEEKRKFILLDHAIRVLSSIPCKPIVDVESRIKAAEICQEIIKSRDSIEISSDYNSRKVGNLKEYTVARARWALTTSFTAEENSTAIIAYYENKSNKININNCINELII